MGYTTYESYALQIQGLLNQSPLDSQTYLLGYSSFVTTGTAYPVMVPRKGVIRKVYITWINVTQDCTAEDTDFFIRVNNTTDSTGTYSGSFANAASPQTFNANLPVDAGDYIHLKMVTPAWVTNPTGVYLNCVVEVQC